MHITFDTNVLVSAFIWQKQLKPIYAAVRAKQLIPCLTQSTWAEFIRVLHYPRLTPQLDKMRITPEEIINLLSSRAYFTIPKLEVHIIKEDPTDNRFLECAVSAQSVYIVSGDKHLLNLKQFQGIPIMTPRQFLIRIKAKK